MTDPGNALTVQENIMDKKLNKLHRQSLKGNKLNVYKSLKAQSLLEIAFKNSKVYIFLKKQ